MSRNMTAERLTRYECARIIGIRASQIGMSAPILIDMTAIPQSKQSNFMYIAALELKARALDIVIRRPLPMNEYVEVNIRDLKIPDDLEALIALYSDM